MKKLYLIAQKHWEKQTFSDYNVTQNHKDMVFKDYALFNFFVLSMGMLIGAIVF